MQIDSNKIINSIKAEIGVEPQFTEISDILKEGSYLFYELEDKEIEYSFDSFDSENSEYNTYTKKISPLFLSHVIDAESNSLLLDIMDEEVPFYHLESSKENKPDTVNISSARDCGVNDVPSPLQESNFYEVWFRESQGAIQNYLLLDVYNKLRWPIINENQYLNASLFPELAQELYNKSSDKESLIEFRNSALENKQDNEFLDEDGSSNKIGCIDYLNGIINQKLTSMYALVDYNPNQSNLLSDWAESVAQSGQMLEEDIDTQLSVYRLQDIKYELLRRKFAGSRTLYSLALASIDRQGSFISTIPAGALTTDNTLFKDKRLIRLVNLPGILSEFNAEASVKPITTFYTDKDEDSAIPLSTLVPLYYTSSFGPYDAEDFYTSSEITNSIYLRDNIHKLEWDNLSGLLSGSSAKRIYPTLDEKIVSQLVETGFRYRTLDDKIEENGEEVTIYLDRRRSILSSSATFGNMFDLSANRLLYNSNTLQQLLKDDYPYLTYPIADGNSVSMMDLPWINYIKTSTENKSRVQDRVDFGAQINKYQEITNNQLGEYNFFAISYGNKIKDDEGTLYKASNLPKLSYDEACAEDEAITIIDKNNSSLVSKKPRFAYLWYCTLKYKTEDFKFSDSDLEKPITTTLISRITLIDKENKDFEDVDAFQELKSYNEGLLPLTYPNLMDDSVLSMRLGVYDKEGTSGKEFYDDLTKNGYTKAQFIFATSDLVGLTEALHTDPREDNIVEPYLSANPSADTKALFYVVRKSIDDQGNYNYRWSEPIKVIEITDKLINDIEEAKGKDSIVTVKPDWYQMMYQLNPYLNFTSKSASTLRHRDVLAAASYKESKGIDQNTEIVIQGPSENTALSNLARSRGMTYTCNDDGSSRMPGRWVDPSASIAANNTYGLYLDRTKASAENFKPEGNDAEYVSIFGDNREKDLFDSSDSDNQDKRSAIRNNSLTYYPCLEFKLSTAATSENPYSTFSPNYLRLQPYKGRVEKDDYSKWAWNEHNDGITLCANISLPDGDYQRLENSGAISYLKKHSNMTLLSRVGESLDNKESITEEDFCSEFDLSLRYVDAENDKNEYQDKFDKSEKDLKDTTKQFKDALKKYNDSLENSQDQIDQIKNKINELKNSINDNEGKINQEESDLAQKEIEKSKISRDLTLINCKLEGFEAEQNVILNNSTEDVLKIAEWNSLIEDLEKKKDEYSTLSKECSKLESDLKLVNISIESNRKDISETQNYLNKATSSSQKQYYRTQLENLYITSEELLKKKQETEQALNKANEEKEEWLNKNDLEKIESELEENKARIKGVQAADACKITGAGKPLLIKKALDNAYGDLKANKEKLEEELKTKEKEIDSLKENIKKYKGSLDRDEAKLKEHEAELKEIQDSLKNLEKKKNDLAIIVAQFKETVNLYNKILSDLNNSKFAITVVFKYYPYGLNRAAVLEDEGVWTIESLPVLARTESQWVLSGSNIRIAASIKFTDTVTSNNTTRNIKMSLITNNNEIELDHKYQLEWGITGPAAAKTIADLSKEFKIDSISLKEILIAKFGSDSIVKDAEGKDAFIPGAACKGNNYIEVMGKTTVNAEGKVTSQDNCFFGSLYDLRLYNTGATGIGLRLLNAGSTRELFSYSPSNYIIGYNLYRDLGIFKEVALRKVVNKLNDVHSIRIFNRSVWDSILTDMYPVSYEEQTNVMPQFTPNYWDPKTDTDIWGIVNGNLTLKDCIEQVLEETAEVNNNQKLFNSTTNNEVIISYNNKEVKLSNSDVLTLINTSIYPVVYDKDSLTTVAVRFGLEGNVASTLEDNPIKLPNAINPVDGVLEYDADINLNYTISPKSNFTNWLSNGTHITLSYNSALQKIMAIYSSTDLAGNVSQTDNSQTNHILVPLTVPKQTDLNWDDIGYFDRINLKGIQLNNDLVTLLRATSYYNELRIPVAIDLVEKNALGILNNRFTTYASKWDAIRTLKEGTYYITCKYPFQILPFEDHLYDTNNEAKYASLYATVRFKIEVRGIPMVYEEGKRGANRISSTYEEKYSASKLNNTLRSNGALFNPEDNRSFPHRAINIDLYVQDIESEAGRMYYNSATGKSQEAYTFKWRLIGTNHSNDYPASKSYLELNRDRLNNGLVLETDIPLFFSKSYNTSFFIAKTEKTNSGTTYNSESADDDLIRPIKLNPRYGAVKVATYIKCANNETAVDGITYYDENNVVIDPQPEEGSNVGNYYTRVENLDKLEAYKESDLDNLVLAAGRSYKILWDYSGKVSEFSFTDNIYSLSNEAQQNLSSSEDISYYMTDSEKVNYARLSSLLDTSNTTDYLYDRDGLSYDHNAVELVGTCGYNVVNSEFKKVSPEKVEDLSKIEEKAKEEGEPAYKSYQALEASNLPDNDDSSVITYIYNEESQSYRYYRYDDVSNTTEEITPSDLDLTKLEAWKFGDYYVYKSIPTVIYKAVVGLTSKVFKYNNQYYKWVDDHYEELSLRAIDSVDYLPTITGNENILYQVGTSYYGCFENQQPFFSDKSNVRNSGTFNFGNPYSRSSAHNFLLSIKNDNLNDSRSNINNSYYFAYTPTEVPGNVAVSSEPITKTIQAYKSKYKDIAYVQLDEANIIKTHHDRISNNVLKAIASLSSKSSGVITALSEFMPRYTYPSASTRAVVENSYVRSVTDSMHAYYSAKRKVPSKNSNITITRKGLYSNNLFASQSFDNEKYWSWGNYNEAYNNTYISGYVSDDDWDEGLGKDVYKIEYKGLNDDIGDNSNYPLTLKYKAGSVVKAASYETALNIKVAGTRQDQIYLGSTSKTDNELVYLEDPEDRPYIGDLSKIYLCKSTVQAWHYNNEEGWQSYPIQKYDSSKPSEENTIYIDSITNSIDVCIIYLSGGVEIEREKLNVTGISQAVVNLDTPVTFADTWYNIASKSSKIIKADTIEFAFCCKEALTFYITKAVARTSSSWSHLLGLSDGLYSNSTSDSESYVELESHRSVVFKNAKTKELLPIQFNAYTNVRNPLFTSLGAKIMYPISGLTKAKDFISSCSLGFPKSTSKLETLYDPNVRRMHYKRQLKSNIVQGYRKNATEFYEVYEDEVYYKKITPNTKNLYLNLIDNKYYEYKNSAYEIVDDTLQSTIPFEETVTFSKYTTAIDDFGIASRKESSSTTKDLYTSADVKYVFKGTQDKSLVVNSLVINDSQSSPLYNYSTNLELTSEIIIDRDSYLIANGPIDLSDETISAMTNCFNPKKYRKNEDSVVAITNIQLIGESETASQDTILYELEYLPIIYKENDQHVSYNIMLRKPSDPAGSLN